MRPVDPTVLRRLPSLRRYLTLAAGLSVAGALLIVAQAIALSAALTSVVLDGAVPAAAVTGFAAAVIARAGLTWAQHTLASRSAATVKARLRGQLVAATGHADGRAGETTTLLTRGMDGIDPYITGYLPQLCLAAAVPVTVLIVLAATDLTSLIIVAVTVPLIPVFGILIGWHTKAKTDRQWHRLSRLGGHFLDMVSGLSTLRVFGRAAASADAVRAVADRYRQATMETLRVAFLSALVLELVATVSVALVAVPIGLRLVSGDMNLRDAFLILLLAPEVYLPLRAMGSQFHAAQEGLSALDDAVGLLDRAGSAPPAQRPLSGGQAVSTPDIRSTATEANRAMQPSTGVIEFDEVTVDYGRPEPALAGVHARIRPGDSIALIGPSGAGKSTLLNLLLGFTTPSSGRITCGGTDLAQLRGDAWLRRIAWVPQRAHLFAVSLADNIRLGQPDASAVDVRAAADAAHVTGFAERLPDGFDTLLGEAGFGLSAGERRRLALARAFLRIRALDCPIVLLDEPTASLDADSETAVAEATTALLAGRTSIVVAHRQALVDEADRLWRIDSGRLSTDVDAESASVDVGPVGVAGSVVSTGTGVGAGESVVDRDSVSGAVSDRASA